MDGERATVGAVIETVSCAHCAVTVEGGPPLEWASSVESGRTVYYCVRCARESLRSIEARLDTAWW